VKKLVSLAGLAAVMSLVVVALATAAQRAETYTVKASLNSRQETPQPKRAVTARGSFTGTYVENKTGAILKWKLTFTRLTGSATAAHIHSGKRGVAGAVIVPLCGPCKSGRTGTTKISKAVVETLEKNGAYVNVHTAMNAGGEIRGQVSVKED
jgi:CHRD domain-containing protein